MDPSFGARLRAQRERQQIALSAISVETKIKLPMLEGLERDDVSMWPAGIYRRAYIRAYARAIGLDPEPLVREFLEAHPDPIVTPAVTETELENPQWPAGLCRLVTAAMAAVPSRRQHVERGKTETLQTEVNLPPAALECPADDEKPLVLELSDAGDDEPGVSPRGQELSHDGKHRPELNLMVAADLCTRLGQVLDKREVAPILEDAVMALDAVGLIVWSWDPRAAALKPSLAYGYGEDVLARMLRVRADADNAIAAAFTSAQACIINGGDGVTGAVVVPLMSHSGCVGVLAIELQHGDEQRELVRAFATILAAQFVTLVGSAPLAEAVNA